MARFQSPSKHRSQILSTTSSTDSMHSIHPSRRQPKAMECPILKSFVIPQSSETLFKRATSANSNLNLFCTCRGWSPIKNRRLRTQIHAVTEAGSAADAAQAEITWQILVGALAGVTPFVFAGIEFSKRIVAQRRCRVCGGSGLVRKDDCYFHCPSCGGFFPWQSWKRFFSG